MYITFMYTYVFFSLETVCYHLLILYYLKVEEELELCLSIRQLEYVQ